MCKLSMIIVIHFMKVARTKRGSVNHQRNWLIQTPKPPWMIWMFYEDVLIMSFFVRSPQVCGMKLLNKWYPVKHFLKSTTQNSVLDQRWTDSSIHCGWIQMHTLIVKFMATTWGRQDPGGPHVGPLNFAIWVVYWQLIDTNTTSLKSPSGIKYQIIKHMLPTIAPGWIYYILSALHYHGHCLPWMNLIALFNPIYNVFQ